MKAFVYNGGKDSQLRKHRFPKPAPGKRSREYYALRSAARICGHTASAARNSRRPSPSDTRRAISLWKRQRRQSRGTICRRAGDRLRKVQELHEGAHEYVRLAQDDRLSISGHVCGVYQDSGGGNRARTLDQRAGSMFPIGAASVVEPVACAINAQSYLHIESGDSVLIYGRGLSGVYSRGSWR